MWRNLLFVRDGRIRSEAMNSRSLGFARADNDRSAGGAPLQNLSGPISLSEPISFGKVFRPNKVLNLRLTTDSASRPGDHRPGCWGYLRLALSQSSCCWLWTQ